MNDEEEEEKTHIYKSKISFSENCIIVVEISCNFQRGKYIHIFLDFVYLQFKRRRRKASFNFCFIFDDDVL